MIESESMAEEIYGNDERIEALWAIKAMEHAEVYFNVSPKTNNNWPSMIQRKFILILRYYVLWIQKWFQG